MEIRKVEIIRKIEKSLSHSVFSAFGDVPRAWLKQRGLTAEVSKAGFNSGQIHHRKPQQFLDELIEVGFLKETGGKARTGKKAYTCFEPYAMVFPLVNEKGETVNFYGSGVKSKKTRYMNEEGIYPVYPSLNTKRLFIVDGIIDAATLLESKVLKKDDSVMALMDGEYKTQHREVLKMLAGKVDVIFWSKIKKEGL
jgi:hypothetical protein